MYEGFLFAAILVGGVSLLGAAGLFVTEFVFPAVFALSYVWDRRLKTWRDRKILEAERPSEARELAEALAEIQRLRTELAERGMR